MSKLATLPLSRLVPHFLLILTLFVAIPASAVTIRVTTTNDETDAGACFTGDTDCSLREAIILSNATPGGSEIILATGATYTLTRVGANENAASTGDLDITETVSIHTDPGAGIATIQAGVAK